MKRIALLLILSAAALMADATGKWSGAAKAPEMGDETQSLFFNFKQDGATLTGTGGPTEGDQHPMEKGTVEGDKLKFQVPVEGKGTIYFDLKTNGDEISGEAQFKRNEGESMKFQVALKKVK